MSPGRYLRTFDIVGLLARHKDGLRLTEIKDALELPVSSLHNMPQLAGAARECAGQMERSLGHIHKPAAEARP